MTLNIKALTHQIIQCLPWARNGFARSDGGNAVRRNSPRDAQRSPALPSARPPRVPVAEASQAPRPVAPSAAVARAMQCIEAALQRADFEEARRQFVATQWGHLPPAALKRVANLVRGLMPSRDRILDLRRRCRPMAPAVPSELPGRETSAPVRDGDEADLLTGVLIRAAQVLEDDGDMEGALQAYRDASELAALLPFDEDDRAPLQRPIRALVVDVVRTRVRQGEVEAARQLFAETAGRFHEARPSREIVRTALSVLPDRDELRALKQQGDKLRQRLRAAGQGTPRSARDAALTSRIDTTASAMINAARILEAADDAGRALDVYREAGILLSVSGSDRPRQELNERIASLLGKRDPVSDSRPAERPAP